MNRYNKLIKNTGIFFIGNFGSKVLTFFLVRLYTELLSTSEYGIIDLFNTTATLAFPIITLCVNEAVIRFSIDDTDNRGKILTNGLLVTALGNLAFVLTAPIFLKIDMFSDNVAWIYLLTLTNSLSTVVAHFSRGIGKSKLFAMSGLLHSVLQIGLNILFLMASSWGIKGYLIASVLANVITTVVVFLVGRLHVYISKNIDKKYLKTMLIYALPLIPNSVFWWVMQSADRYIIAYVLTASDNGLYAVANKIPTLISTVSGIFFQAWQISSVEEAKSDTKKQFYSNVFSALSTMLIIATSFVLLILQPLYKILTEKAYHAGWVCTPFLLCAAVFSCYSSFLGTNYVAMKKTNGVFLTTVAGAVTNVALNFLLTPIMGLIGTALATLIAYVLTWGIRVLGTRQFVDIKYSVFTFWIPSALLLCQACLLSFGIDSVLIQIAFFAAILILFTKEILKYTKTAFKFIKKLKSGDS